MFLSVNPIYRCISIGCSIHGTCTKCSTGVFGEKCGLGCFYSSNKFIFRARIKLNAYYHVAKYNIFEKFFKIFGFKEFSIFSALENAVNVLSRSSYIQSNNRFHTFEMDFKCLFLFEEFLDLGRSEY